MKEAASSRAAPQSSPSEAPSTLPESDLKYRALFEAATDAIFLETLDGRILDCNPAALRMFGFTLEEMRQLTVTDLVPEEVARTLPALITEELIAGGFFVEAVNRRKNGELFPVEVSTRLVRIAGEPQVVVFVRDITERKRAEAALAAEKERLAVTLRSIGDGVIATDEQGRVVLVNQVAESLTGWSQEEAVGRPLDEVFHLVDERTRRRCESPVRQVIDTGKVVSLSGQMRLISRDGREYLIADTCAPIRDRQNRVMGVVLAFRDITQLRKMEEERLRAQKLESLGMLAGGIAHDFNNILTGILGNISLARMAIQAGSEQPVLLSEAEKACIRAKDLSQQLLTFARGGGPVRQLTSIVGLLRDTVEFCLRGSNVRSELFVPEDLWWLEADPGQIAQVINNIVLNSKQAMPYGGVVVVRAENAILTGAEGFGLPAGRYVAVTIRDSGEGIPPENLDRIFDPFFTTKKQGSGLGLAAAYAIIRKHSGHIAVESELGRGTTVRFYLPASKNAAADSFRREDETVLFGRGRVLVMDDEEPVRKVATRVLEYLGYEPVVVANGPAAVEEYRKAHASRRPFAAVVLDLTVPGEMGGRETLRQLLELDPEVKAVVASGYSTDDVLATYQTHGFAGALTKPFTVHEMGRVLHAVLRGEN